jgi:condensin-2 complex subunit H2
LLIYILIIISYYFVIPDDEEEILARRVQNALEEGLNSTQSTTYESLCRRHIENFMQGAELYARETGLSARVSAWTRTLENVLVEQEMRPQFDIHAYSDEVLTKVEKFVSDKAESKSSTGASDTAVEFSTIVNGESSYEICRVFLACLQLANLGNISLKSERSALDSNGTLRDNAFKVQVLNNNLSSLSLELDS